MSYISRLFYGDFNKFYQENYRLEGMETYTIVQKHEVSDN